MIKINELHWHYGNDFSLHLPSFELAAGGNCALVGASGSGKSTLFKLLVGEFLAQKGSIAFNEQDWSSLNEAQRRQQRLNSIGQIFQSPRLLDWMTIEQNIILPMQLSGGKTDSERLVHLAQQAGIQHLLKRKPSQLSEGECQRAAVVRALLPQPKMLLADEPTASLDPKNAQIIAELIIESSRACGATLIFITHDHALLPLFEQELNSETWTVKKSLSAPVSEHSS